MYAIINQKTKKFVYGTDYRYNPPHQRTSWNQMLTYEDLYMAAFELRHRRCGKNYTICEVEVKVSSVLERSTCDQIRS